MAEPESPRALRVPGKLVARAGRAMRSFLISAAWIGIFLLISRTIYFHLGTTRYAAGQEPDDYFHVVLHDSTGHSRSVGAHRWEFGSSDGSTQILNFEAVEIRNGQHVELRYDIGDYVFRSTYRVEGGTVVPESMHTGHAMTAGAAALLGLIATLLLRLVIVGVRPSDARSGTPVDERGNAH